MEAVDHAQHHSLKDNWDVPPYEAVAEAERPLAQTSVGTAAAVARASKASADVVDRGSTTSWAPAWHAQSDCAGCTDTRARRLARHEAVAAAAVVEELVADGSAGPARQAADSCVVELEGDG